MMRASKATSNCPGCIGCTNAKTGLTVTTLAGASVLIPATALKRCARPSGCPGRQLGLPGWPGAAPSRPMASRNWPPLLGAMPSLSPQAWGDACRVFPQTQPEELRKLFIVSRPLHRNDGQDHPGAWWADMLTFSEVGFGPCPPKCWAVACKWTCPWPEGNYACAMPRPCCFAGLEDDPAQGITTAKRVVTPPWQWT
jgi:hypothetical protein